MSTIKLQNICEITNFYEQYLIPNSHINICLTHTEILSRFDWCQEFFIPTFSVWITLTGLLIG